MDLFSTTVVLLFKRKEAGLEWCWFKTWMAGYVADYNSFTLEFVVNISFPNKIVQHLRSQVNFISIQEPQIISLILRRMILFSAAQFLELSNFNS